MKRRVICCLWDGRDLPDYSRGKFGWEDVFRLERAVARHAPDPTEFVILTDDLGSAPPSIGRVQVLGFEGHEIGGWTNMLEAFRPSLDFDGRTVLIGLDTVITGDLAWLFEWGHSPVGLPRDPYETSVACNAVTTYTAGGAHLVWRAYRSAVTANRMSGCQLAGKPSEMMLLRHLQQEYGWKFLDDTHPGKLLSYKVHLRDGPTPQGSEDASLVYFHGTPKPQDLPNDHPLRIKWENP